MVKKVVLLPKIVNIKEQLDEIISVPEVKLNHEEDTVAFVKKAVLLPKIVKIKEQLDEITSEP